MAIVDGNATEIVRDPLWFANSCNESGDTLSFVHTDRDALAREPFLDERWKREAFERRALPLAALAAAMPQGAPPPRLNFIWHTSFCCSTMIAEALDRPGRNLSLREPMVLPRVAVARQAAMLAGRTPPPRLGEIVFRLLGRPMSPGECVTVKPSNFANALIEDAARLTEGRVLFLYSSLESFLISIEKGGAGLRCYARRLFGDLAGRMPLPWRAAEVFLMSDLEIAAFAWHFQISEFQRAARVLGPERAASLDCEAFLKNPAAALAALDAFFDLGLGEDHIAGVVSGPLMKRHAKAPGHPFDAEQRRARADDVRARLGRDLQRIIEGSYKAYPDASPGAPLGDVRALVQA